MGSACMAVAMIALCLGSGTCVRQGELYLEAVENVIATYQAAEDAWQVAECALALSGIAFTDICAVASKITEHWGDADGGCGVVVEDIVSPDYIACVAIMGCSNTNKDDMVADPWMGLCLQQCENTYQDGVLSTQCEKSVLISAGMDHPEICGDSLPVEAEFAFMSPVEILLSAMLAVGFVIVQAASTAFANGKDVEHFTIDISKPLWFRTQLGMSLAGGVEFTCCEVFGMAYHSLVIVHMFAYMVHVLANAGATCRFVLLNTPAMYGPYFFSWIQCATLFYSLIPRSIYLEVRRGEGLFCSDSSKRGQTCLFCLILTFSVPWLIATVLQFAAGISMLVVSFWGFVAYVHISLIMLLALGLVFLSIFLPVCFGICCIFDQSRLREAERSLAVYDETVDDMFRGLMIRHVPIVAATSGAFAMYICICTFFVYFTGDYMGFHTAFFDQLESLSLPSLPAFGLPPWSVEFLGILQRLVSFDFGVPPVLLYEASVNVQVALTLVIIVERVIRLRVCRCRRRAAQPCDTQA